MASGYKFYSKPEYLKDLIKRFSAAGPGDRLVLATMALNVTYPLVNEVIEALCQAAARGAQVSLAVDANTFLAYEHSVRFGPLFWRNRLHSHMSGRYQPQFEALKKLQASGGKYVITNLPARPFTRPFAGRSHIKYAVVNERLYIGGCNIDAAEQVDLMVGWDDKRATDWVYGWTKKVMAKQNTRLAARGQDLSCKLKDGSILMIDCGLPRQSLILKTALDIIDRAQKSIFVSFAYTPTRVVLKHLKTAFRRGVNITLIYNHPSKYGAFSLLHAVAGMRERVRTPKLLLANRRLKSARTLHAKLITTEDCTIIGSHNFVAEGVNFGTAEIALVNYSPDFARQALAALKKQL